MAANHSQDEHDEIGCLIKNHQRALDQMKAHAKEKTMDLVKEHLLLSKNNHDDLVVGRHSEEGKPKNMIDIRQILATVIDEAKMQDLICKLLFHAEEEAERTCLLSAWLDTDKYAEAESSKQSYAQKLHADFNKHKNGHEFRLDSGPMDEQAKQSSLVSTTSQDLLIRSISDIEGQQKEWHIGIIRLTSETPTYLPQLASKYRELHPSNMHIGIDNMMCNSSRLCAHRHAVGREVTARAYAPMARQFLKFGAPASLRPELWRVALGMQAECADAERENYKRLVRKAKELPLPAVDGALDSEMEVIRNDVTYFPFEEKIRRVLGAFSRDEWIAECSPFSYYPIIESQLGEKGLEVPDDFPPCGVLPLRDTAGAAAPLSLLYEREEDMHTVLRQLHVRFWCRLGAVSSLPGTITNLCRTFEDLLLMNGYAIFSHMLKLGLHPVNVAFSWIHSTFENFFDIDQLFFLWDRIIGYDDLYLLPALAASIFMFRSEQILAAESVAEVEDILKDGSRLKVVPLLQTFLFPEAFR